MKYREILNIREEVIEDINRLSNVYSENYKLYEDYGIEENDILHCYSVKYSNGYYAELRLCSHTDICCLELSLYNTNYDEVSLYFNENYLYDGQEIEFEVDNDVFIVEIKQI